MGIQKDLTGQKFGRLLALRKIGVNKFRHTVWFCLCDCGEITGSTSGSLLSENAKSCGCLQKEIAAKNCKKRSIHNMSGTRTFNSWSSMKQRCYDKNLPDYFRWGGRGIKVCKRWVDSFENFLKDMGIRPRGTTIDRIDNNGNYEPSNCRWATYSQQNRNQRKRNANYYCQ